MKKLLLVLPLILSNPSEAKRTMNHPPIYNSNSFQAYGPWGIRSATSWEFISREIIVSLKNRSKIAQTGKITILLNQAELKDTFPPNSNYSQGVSMRKIEMPVTGTTLFRGTASIPKKEEITFNLPAESKLVEAYSVDFTYMPHASRSVMLTTEIEIKVEVNEDKGALVGSVTTHGVDYSGASILQNTSGIFRAAAVLQNPGLLSARTEGFNGGRPF